MTVIRTIVMGCALAVLGIMVTHGAERAVAQNQGVERCDPACGPDESCTCRCESDAAVCDPDKPPTGCTCICGCEDKKQ